MNVSLTLTVHRDGIALLAHGPDGLATWDGFYRWDVYGLGMPARVLRDLPDWIIENAPTWVHQWEAAEVSA
jgi:hypothetical protein